MGLKYHPQNSPLFSVAQQPATRELATTNNENANFMFLYFQKCVNTFEMCSFLYPKFNNMDRLRAGVVCIYASCGRESAANVFD